jgi:hypothetical protein
MFIRTPYGANPAFTNSQQYKELSADGYVFVFQDIRGRYASEGQFVMVRSPRNRKDPKAIDESTDAYDSIEWLVKQIPNNNGRVGMRASVPRLMTVMAMLILIRRSKPSRKRLLDMFPGDDLSQWRSSELRLRVRLANGDQQERRYSSSTAMTPTPGFSASVVSPTSTRNTSTARS